MQRTRAEPRQRRLVDRVSAHARWLVERGISQVLERRYGVETMEHVSLKDLGVDGPGRVWHHPCDWVAVSRALRRHDPGPDDVFVDFGSGLGRALLIAGRLDFGRVIGVELSGQLADRARRNVERNAGRMRAGSVEVVTADALEWDIPDEMTFAFLYCPFIGELFGRIFERILASLERRPRALRMVYAYPVEHMQVISSGRAQAIDVTPATFPARTGSADNVIVTYLLLPPGGAETVPGSLPTTSRTIRRHPEWTRPYDPGFVLEEPAPRSLQ